MPDLVAGFSIASSIGVLTGHRVCWPSFQSPPTSAGLRVVRVEALEAGLPLIGSLASSGSFKLTGDTLEVCIPDEVAAAESAFRLAWQICTIRAGGVLVHSSGVVHNGHALVAAGQSGAGKSTISTLAVEAGCIPLSDEIVQVFPDGTVRGTPFRSNATFDGTPTLAPLAYAVSLHHGDREELREVPAENVVRTFLSQVYTQPGLEMPKGHASRVILSALSKAHVGELSYRKHSDAGTFVRGLLE